VTDRRHEIAEAVRLDRQEEAERRERAEVYRDLIARQDQTRREAARRLFGVHIDPARDENIQEENR
jgi:hypothetical protein